MQKRIFAAATIIIALTTFASAANSNEKVRIKLFDLPLPLVLSDQVLTVHDTHFSRNQKVFINRTDNKWEIRSDDEIITSQEKLLQIQSSSRNARLGEYLIPSAVYLAAEDAASVAVIGLFDFNDYLEGVLLSEMPLAWPTEALKAQAIVARSYALHQMETRKNEPYHLEGNILDQNFSLKASPADRARVKEIVESTEGKILIQSGQVLKAFYHSDCGGQTEEPSQIWAGGSAQTDTGSVKDEHCPSGPLGKWTMQISFDELKAKLKPFVGRVPKIYKMHIESFTPSGRVAKITFNNGEKNVRISATEFRRILGFRRLKSTMFSISQKGDFVVFKGRGFGHGSGLCQWGARFMAERGATVSEILNHYYPRAQLSLNVAHR